jgi:superfamily I DNA and/or RNA helicase
VPPARSLFERLAAKAADVSLLATQYRAPPALAAFPSARFYASRLRAVCKSNLQPDFNVRVFEEVDIISSASRELDESDRFVQKSAESTSIWPR